MMPDVPFAYIYIYIKTIYRIEIHGGNKVHEQGYIAYKIAADSYFYFGFVVS